MPVKDIVRNPAILTIMIPNKMTSYGRAYKETFSDDTLEQYSGEDLLYRFMNHTEARDLLNDTEASLFVIIYLSFIFMYHRYEKHEY